MASLDILALQAGALVAPAALWCEAVGLSGFDVPGGPGPGEIYDPAFHEITYVWTITRPAGAAATFSTPLNMPDVWKTRNTAYGKHIACVLDEPGEYTIEVWAVDASGTTGTKSLTVTVADPSDIFTGNSTILVDPAGAGDAASYPGAQVVTGIDAAVSALSALGQAGRILLKRGETYPDVKLQIGGMVNFRMGAWGTGARPKLTPLPQPATGANNEMFRISNSATVSDFCIHDLDLEGTWDAATLTGDPRDEPFYWLTHTGAATPFYVVHKCRIAKFQKVTTSNISDGIDSTTIFSEVERRGWQDYGFFGHDMNQGRLAFVGCSTVQDPDAVYNGGKDGFGNDHGPLRNSRTPKVYVGASDFFSINGWSSAGGNAITAAQPCLRVNSDGAEGVSWNVERVSCEGGYQMVDTDSASASFLDSACNHVFDKILLVGTSQTQGFVVNGAGGVTFRNVLAAMPSVTEVGLGAHFVFKSEADNPQPGNYDARVAIFNNTALNLQPHEQNTRDDMVFDTGGTAWGPDYIVENNLFHAPVQLTPETGSAPVDLATPMPGFTSRHIGVRTGPERIAQTLGAPVASGATVDFPYPVGFAQADFAPGTGHAVTLDSGDEYWFEAKGDIAVSFGTSTITVTNQSGTTWAAGRKLRLNPVPAAPVTDAVFASPASIPLPVPAPGSPAITGGAAGLWAYDDLFGTIRASGTRGAVETG